MSAAAARRVFLTLTLTRWFPVGLVAGIMTLWPLERGLSVTAAITASAFTGWVVFAVELPTSGFADAFGRRPVYVAAAIVSIAAATTYLLATSFWGFVVGAILMGVFRALDSGPLEAWFVDAAHADDPDADVAPTLATQSTFLGVAMASGALASAALIAWHPVDTRSALFLPFVLFVMLTVVHLVAVLLLLDEERTGTDARRAADSVREAPVIVRESLALLRSNRVLRCLVLVEVFWALAMIVFETFTSIRLAELLGSQERAGAWMGATSAAAWIVFAAGSTAAGLLAPRIGLVRTAILARVLNGLGVVVMGAAAGPGALVVAYLVTYGLHGTGGPAHLGLLHREATSRNRATVLSINSMLMFASYSAAAPLVALLAGATSNQVAMMTAGSLSILGALLYLPARHVERTDPASRDAISIAGSGGTVGTDPTRPHPPHPRESP